MVAYNPADPEARATRQAYLARRRLMAVDPEYPTVARLLREARQCAIVTAPVTASRDPRISHAVVKASS